MASLCKICNNSDRQQIETALLSGISIESVAKEYGVTVNELKVHTVMHLGTFGTEPDGEFKLEESSSLAQKLKIQEAIVLRNTYQEYYATLKRIGAHISKGITRADAENLPLNQTVTRVALDLYLGAGNQIRETIKTLAEIDSQINGEKSGVAGGLSSLAEAINRSRSTE